LFSIHTTLSYFLLPNFFQYLYSLAFWFGLGGGQRSSDFVGFGFNWERLGCFILKNRRQRRGLPILDCGENNPSCCLNKEISTIRRVAKKMHSPNPF
jgi:hypothetical protein